MHKISIVQRGFGALGYTMQLPLEDRYLMHARRPARASWRVLLGGRTAEEIALGEISTGAQNDLQRATDIARAMVTEFGMSDALGAINYDGNKRDRFLDLPLPAERGCYAEDTAQMIDAEIKRILTDAHNKAREVLTANRDKLERVTRRLLEIEVMEGDELAPAAGTPARGTIRREGSAPTDRLRLPLRQPRSMMWRGPSGLRELAAAKALRHFQNAFDVSCRASPLPARQRHERASALHQHHERDASGPPRHVPHSRRA